MTNYPKTPSEQKVTDDKAAKKLQDDKVAAERTARENVNR